MSGNLEKADEDEIHGGGHLLFIFDVLFGELLRGGYGLVSAEHPYIASNTVAFQRLGIDWQYGCLFWNVVVVKSLDDDVSYLRVAACAWVEHAHGIGQNGFGFQVAINCVTQGVNEVISLEEGVVGPARNVRLIGRQFFEDLSCYL